MIKLNDQKKLAKDYIYFKKCRNFYLLSLIITGIYIIILLILHLLIALNVNLLFWFFMVMHLGLIPLRTTQLEKAKEIWYQKFQTTEEQFANKP